MRFELMKALSHEVLNLARLTRLRDPCKCQDAQMLPEGFEPSSSVRETEILDRTRLRERIENSFFSIYKNELFIAFTCFTLVAP